MKVVELKEELNKRTCSIKGVTAELKLRLKDAVDNNIPLATNIADAVMDNIAGDEFALGAKWELEGANDDGI